ncbi:MAG: hypothetical protein GMKNLPBB_02802 [Myxococcota bacterium]|nr:hypothetical protein [Myxococcota bacterium]
MRYWSLTLGVAGVLAAGEALAQGNTVSAVQVRTEGANAIVTIQCTAAPDFTTFRLQDPERFVVDVSGVKLKNVAPRSETKLPVLSEWRAAAVGEGEKAQGRFTFYVAKDAEVDAKINGNSLVLKLIGRTGPAAQPPAITKAPPPKPAAEEFTEESEDGAPPAKPAPPAAAPPPAMAAKTPPPSAAPAPQGKEILIERGVAPAPAPQAKSSTPPPVPVEEAELPKPPPVKPAPAPAPQPKVAAAPPAPAKASAPAAAEDEFYDEEFSDEEFFDEPGAGAKPSAPAASRSRPAPVEPAPVARPVERSAASPAAYSRGPSAMGRLAFRQEQEKSRVIVRTNEPVEYYVNEVGDNRVVVELVNTRIPLRNNKNLLDAEFFSSAVKEIRPKSDQSGVRIEITLREKVPYDVRQEKNEIHLEFKRTLKPNTEPGAPAGVQEEGAAAVE